MNKKFKYGDKVIPHSKNAGWCLFEECIEWIKAQKNNQPYLFVNGWNDEKQSYLIGYKLNDGGNYYKESDLTLYEDSNQKQKTSKQETILIETLPHYETKIKQETILIETLPHYETKIYKNEDRNVDIRNILVQQEVKKVIYNEKTTIVILSDGIKGISKCSPDDGFDKKKGYQIALRRAYIKRLQKELKELTK